MRLSPTQSCIYRLLVLILLLQSTYTLGCTVAYCTSCLTTSNNTCQTCNTGYNLVNTTCCKNTLQNCSKCTVNTSSCDSCLSSAYCMLNSSCTACSDHISNCSTCTNCSSCHTCKDNTFALNNSTLCALCSSFMSLCWKCSNSTVCTNCVNDTYGVNSTSHQCQPCSSLLSDCTNCNSDTQCVSCTGSPLIILSSGRCKNCGSVIPNCVNCTMVNNCTLCYNYYAILVTAYSWTCSLCGNLMHGCLNCSSATVCVKCSLGRIVSMGCSSVPGCTSVMQKYPISVCTSCDFTEFQVLPINGSCVCIKGSIAGQHCTQIIGCTNIIRNASGDFCSKCSERESFYLDNITCSCLPYFLPSGQTCKEICGDGRLYVLACDDGNLINGDGCSSSCKVESGFNCIAGHNNTASVCKYEERIKAELACVYKLDTPNAARLLISFTPFVSNLLRIDFLNYLSFNFSTLCQVSSVQFEGKDLQVTVSYSQDLQSSEASILVQYDPFYILSPESLISTTIKECNGDRLVYDPDSKSSSKQTLTLIIKLISLLTLLLWLVGSCSHKLIGIETLQTIHLIFIMQVFAPRYRPVVAYFIGLVNSMNFFQSMTSKSQALTSITYQRLKYSSDFVYNFGIVALLQLFALLAFAFLGLWRLLKSKTITQRTDQLWQGRIAKYKPYIYKFLMFPTLIGFFLSFIISLQIYSTHSVSKSYTNFAPVAVAILFIFVATAIVFFDEWKYILKSQEPSKAISFRIGYVAHYLSYLILLSFVTSLSLNQLIPFPLYVFATIVVLYFIFIVVYRPYRDSVHNIGLFINQTGLIFNLAWLISQDFLYLNRFMDQVIAFAIVGWMVLILLWSSVRIVFELRKPAVSQVAQEKKAKQRVVQTYEEYQQQIVRAIIMQTESSINYYRLTSQLLPSREIQQLQELNKYGDQQKLLLCRLKYKITEEQQNIGIVRSLEQ